MEVIKVKKYVPFLSFWGLNAILLYLAVIVFPLNYVVGNASLRPPAAIVFSGLVWTLLVWYSTPICRGIGLKLLKGRSKMLVFYFLANSAGIWLTARGSAITGFGITSFVWAIYLGFVANIAQWGLWQGVKRMK